MNVDFEGRFVFSLDPMNLVIQGSYLNGTRASAYIECVSFCPDQTTKFTGEIVLDNNQFVTLGE